MSEQQQHEIVSSVIADPEDRRRLPLLPLLDPSVSRPASTTREEMEALPEPEISVPGVRFDYSYNELTEMAQDLTPGGPDDIRRVVRYALIWSGMKIGDDALSWATLDHGYKPGTRLSRVMIPVDDKRLSVRAVPNAWGGVHETPFTLSRGETGGMRVMARNGDGGETEIARPTVRHKSESVQTLAYVAGQRDGSVNITANPLQRCPQTCEFCCRGYHDMTAERRKELVNLSPDEMARALLTQFPKIENWGDVSGITFSTGDFRGEVQILEYVEQFVSAMNTVTSGQWNPQKNDNQYISVLTHLLKTRAGLEKAKELGMKRFIHTVEMTDAERREQVMHLNQREFQSTPRNKGHTSFDGILDVLSTAVEVFEPKNVEAILVVGLDPLERTRQAMDQLKAIGITTVGRALINIYNMNQFGLVPGSFEDAVSGMQYAKELFTSPHRKRISTSAPKTPQNLQV